MTEVEKVAREYFEDSATWGRIVDFTTHNDIEKCVDNLKETFMQSVIPLIERMQNCENCNKCKDETFKNTEECLSCINFSHWELKDS